MANGDPDSSVNEGSPVSLVDPTLNRYRMALRPYALKSPEMSFSGSRHSMAD